MDPTYKKMYALHPLLDPAVEGGVREFKENFGLHALRKHGFMRRRHLAVPAG